MTIKHKKTQKKIPKKVKNKKKSIKHKVIHVKFNKKQLFQINKEYQRWISYKYIVIDVNKLLGIKNYRDRKENINIIDRFILELINDGISRDKTGKHLFFNHKLQSYPKLSKSDYYPKMIDEYQEKQIKLTPKKINNLLKIYQNAEKKFKYNCQQLPNTYKSSIIIKKGKVAIHYQNYKRIIGLERYNLLKNNYRKANDFDIVKMTLRNALFEGSGQQWSYGINLYQYIAKEFNISLEMFASPLNFLTKRFCSIFYDTDVIFGGLGSFFNLTAEKLINNKIKGAICNPPYIESFMNKIISFILKILNKFNKNSYQINIIFFVPNWEDAIFINSLKNSKFTIYDKILKKGEYVLNEKDLNRVRIDNSFDSRIFILNSMKDKLSDKQLNNLNIKCEKIGKFITKEVKELKTKK